MPKTFQLQRDSPDSKLDPTGGYAHTSLWACTLLCVHHVSLQSNFWISHIFLDPLVICFTTIYFQQLGNKLTLHHFLHPFTSSENPSAPWMSTIHVHVCILHAPGWDFHHWLYVIITWKTYFLTLFQCFLCYAQTRLTTFIYIQYYTMFRRKDICFFTKLLCRTNK